jgi:hypothetical protein
MYETLQLKALLIHLRHLALICISFGYAALHSRDKVLQTHISESELLFNLHNITRPTFPLLDITNLCFDGLFRICLMHVRTLPQA